MVDHRARAAFRLFLYAAAGLILLLHSDQAMAEGAADAEAAVEHIYHEMYRCMISKDTQALALLLDDSFALVHMTGMRQTKAEYLQAIADNTLNYYACTDTHLSTSLRGDSATLVGRSRVAAAVFGGRRHTWPLQLTLNLIKKEGQWRILLIRASTY